jgi:hypothetical protein
MMDGEFKAPNAPKPKEPSSSLSKDEEQTPRVVEESAPAEDEKGPTIVQIADDTAELVVPVAGTYF